MNVEQILNDPDKLTLVFFLLIVLVTGARRMWVWGWSYDAIVKDRDEWKELALQRIDVMHEAVDIAATTRKRPKR